MWMAKEILDLDKLIPDDRIIRLAGREINVSKIPSQVTLEMASKSEVLQSGSDESFDEVFDMILKICNANKSENEEEVTKEWIVSNTSMDQLLTLIEFVMKPLNDRAAEGNKKGKKQGSKNQ